MSDSANTAVSKDQTYNHPFQSQTYTLKFEQKQVSDNGEITHHIKEVGRVGEVRIPLGVLDHVRLDDIARHLKFNTG